MWLEMTTSRYRMGMAMKATSMLPKKMKIELKSQQPWTVVSLLLGLISVAQLAHEELLEPNQFWNQSQMC